MKTPREVFEAFFTAEIIEEVVTCTNGYGVQKFLESWKPVTKNEMLGFIAILIATGRNKQNHVSLDELWTSNKVWRIEFYRLVMSKNRFKQIYICLRFDDRSTRPQRFQVSNDKLEPIRSVFDKFVARCQDNYVAPKNLTVDERLCLFRGKH